MPVDSKGVKTAYPNGVGASTSYGPQVGDGCNTPAYRPMSHIKRQIAMQLREGTLEADFQNSMLHAFPSGCFVTEAYAFVAESAPAGSSAALSFTDVDGNTTVLPVLTGVQGEWVVERDLDRSLRARSQIIGTVTGEITVVIGFLQTVEDASNGGILAQPGEYPVFNGPGDRSV